MKDIRAYTGLLPLWVDVLVADDVRSNDRLIQMILQLSYEREQIYTMSVSSAKQLIEMLQLAINEVDTTDQPDTPDDE